MSRTWSEGGNIISWGNGPRKIGGVLNGTGRDQSVNLGQIQDGEESFKSQSQLFVQKTSLDEGVEIEVPEGYNAIAYVDYTVNGTLTVSGEMHITTVWPA